jgi:hypothetical protein
VEKVAERGGLRPVAGGRGWMRCPALALSLWMPIRRTCGLDADACPSLPVCAAGPVGIAETTRIPATEWRYAHVS